MRRPFDVELLAVIEGNVDVLRNELVKYHTIIDTLNLYISAIELSPSLRQLARIDCIDVEEQLRGVKIGRSLLMRRIDVHQNDLGRIVVADDRAPGQVQKASAIES